MPVFNTKDATSFLASGAREFRHGRDTQVTPAARDILTEAGIKVVFDARAAATPTAPAPTPAPGVAAPPAAAATPGSLSATTPELARLFTSPEAEAIKRQICEIGHRGWLRDYNDGNGGNISARFGEHFLCTPTGISKGFMQPGQIVLVDAFGNQVAGYAPWRRTSEILSHLGIYRAVPAAAAVVHAHPIHATAFAMSGVEPPQCLIPEVEVFVGTIPVAEYKTPGSPQMSELLGQLAPRHQAILMGNHGLICWGTSVEDAFFKMEITDSYCRTLWVAAQLPSRRTTIPKDEMKILLELKQKLGLPDARLGQPADALCACDPWESMADRPQACATPAAPPTASSLAPATHAELEALVRQLTDKIMAELSK